MIGIINTSPGVYETLIAKAVPVSTYKVSWILLEKLWTDSNNGSEPEKAFLKDNKIYFNGLDIPGAYGIEDLCEYNLDTLTIRIISNGYYVNTATTADSSALPIVAESTTYYNDCSSMSKISNPLIGSDVKMRYKGFFEKENNRLIKNKQNRGVIYCNDSSNLFDALNGYVSLKISFNKDIINGIYQGIQNDEEYLLWGTNIGEIDEAIPTINAKLTKNGITFTISTENTDITITDTTTNINADEITYLEFAWLDQGIDENIDQNPLPTMLLRVNNVTTAYSSSTLTYSNIEDTVFSILDNTSSKYNLECSITEIVIASIIPKIFYEEVEVSSSSSSTEARTSSSSSSSSESSNSSISESSNGIIVAIDGGFSHSLGVKSDGTVVNAGYAGFYDSSWTNIISVKAGISNQDKTLGLRSDGTVLAIGANSYGECYVSDWIDIIEISNGWGHSLGLKSDGTVIGAGRNYFNQINVSSWTNITAISSYYAHSLGLKSNGTVVATGNNAYGQLDVGSWTDIVAISAGDFYSLGVNSDGYVLAVGDNTSGQCNVNGWTDIIDVDTTGYFSADPNHTLGLKSDGSVVAVGDNTFGQCNVNGWTDIVAISAGNAFSLGLKSDGSVVAVGDNSSGQCNVSSW